MYTHQRVIANANWALENGASRVVVVGAHEIAAHNRMALKSAAFHAQTQLLKPDVPGLEIAGDSGPRQVPLFPQVSEADIHLATKEQEEFEKRLKKRRKEAARWKKKLEPIILKLLGQEKAGLIQIQTQAEVYEALATTFDRNAIAIKNLLLNGLLLSRAYQGDIHALMQQAIPGLWTRLHEGEAADRHMASAYMYTTEQILLTYLLACDGLRIKMGPETERVPDGMARALVAGRYMLYPLPTMPPPQGFVYLGEDGSA